MEFVDVQAILTKYANLNSKGQGNNAIKVAPYLPAQFVGQSHIAAQSPFLNQSHPLKTQKYKYAIPVFQTAPLPNGFPILSSSKPIGMQLNKDDNYNSYLNTQNHNKISQFSKLSQPLKVPLSQIATKQQRNLIDMQNDLRNKESQLNEAIPESTHFQQSSFAYKAYEPYQSFIPSSSYYPLSSAYAPLPSSHELLQLSKLPASSQIRNDFSKNSPNIFDIHEIKSTSIGVSQNGLIPLSGFNKQQSFDHYKQTELNRKLDEKYLPYDKNIERKIWSSQSSQFRFPSYDIKQFNSQYNSKDNSYLYIGSTLEPKYTSGDDLKYSKLNLQNKPLKQSLASKPSFAYLQPQAGRIQLQKYSLLFPQPEKQYKKLNLVSPSTQANPQGFIPLHKTKQQLNNEIYDVSSFQEQQKKVYDRLEVTSKLHNFRESEFNAGEKCGWGNKVIYDISYNDDTSNKKLLGRWC